MTDILTQLHHTYDQLLTQIFSTLSYLSQRHPTLAPIPDLADPYTTTTSDQIAPGPEDTNLAAYPLRPNSPSTFAAAQEELADDLVHKGKYIEYLISRLPGQERGEQAQEERIRELAAQVREVEKLQREKRKEVRILVERLDAVVAGMGTSIKASGGEVNGNQVGGGHG